ncbi:hypothetical protein [Psychrobacter sp. FME5]|uniref:hypothetical protein n=1 Tax=Psychrobacter sp. FME5 TaxID=2487706 RepID=UPI001787BB2F|nr:hypothetical protein [Psychrobacter sp. FME5]MBE0444936.1 hypothetical protein [Psychrobacter sp. FME5]
MKNTSLKYDVFINRGNAGFYAAKNPEQYDPNSFDIRDMLDMQKALKRYSNK